MIDDRYYINYNVIKQACEDSKLNSNVLTSSIKVLFFSLCIRKKFEIPICWATKEDLDMIENSSHSDFWKRNYLRESLEEDNYSCQNYSIKMDPIQSLLNSIPVSAGGCKGKIKLIVLNHEKKFFEELFSKFNIPALVINVDDGAKELNQIHNELMRD